MAYNKETGMYEGFIYKITNAVNGKIYIGQTRQTINTRWIQHKHMGIIDNPKLYIHRSMKIHGIDNYSISQIDMIASNNIADLEKKLDDLEISYIAKYNSRVPNGYNVSIGGDSKNGTLCCKAVDVYDIYMNLLKTCYSIREASDFTGVRYDTVQYIVSNNNTSSCQNGFLFKQSGIPLTDEDIELYLLNNPFYYKYDKFGNLLNEYTTVEELLSDLSNENIFNPNWNHIVRAMREDGRSAYGYIWRKYPETFNSKKVPDLVIKRNVLPIEQRDKKTGAIINVYDTYNDILKDYPFIDTTFISSCCRNDRNHTGYGFIWNFQGEYIELNESQKRWNESVDQYDISGKYLRTFKDAFTAAIFCNLKRINIYNCCVGNTKTSGGYIWRYHGEPLGDIDLYRKVNYPVCLYDSNGILINTYNNVYEVAIQYNVSKETVIMCCNGSQILLLDKYILRYADDQFDKYRTKRCSEKPVVQLDNDYNIIHIYKSGTEANIITGINKNSISAVCNNKNGRKYAGGYKWMFLENYNKLYNKEVKYA